MRPFQTGLNGLKHEKNQNEIYPIMTPPPANTHTKWPKSWGYVDFKMAANENALTQPKFDLGICGIIQNVFQGD